MTSCVGKSCLTGLLCLYFVNVYQFACVHSVFESEIRDLIVLVPDNYPSFYLAYYSFLYHKLTIVKIRIDDS